MLSTGASEVLTNTQPHFIPTTPCVNRNSTAERFQLTVSSNHHHRCFWVTSLFWGHMGQEGAQPNSEGGKRPASTGGHFPSGCQNEPWLLPNSLSTTSRANVCAPWGKRKKSTPWSTLKNISLDKMSGFHVEEGKPNFSGVEPQALLTGPAWSAHTPPSPCGSLRKNNSDHAMACPLAGRNNSLESFLSLVC